MTTLLSSFNQALPDIAQQLVNQMTQAPRAHVSGSNTENCNPPVSAFEIPVAHWLEKADDLCLFIPGHRTNLQRGYMPVNELAQLIYSEQDVVNASTLHFTHPVNVALNLVHSQDYYRSEVTKGKSKTTSSNNPQGTTSRSRVDTLYYKGRPALRDQQRASSNPMACLEFKKFRALDAESFNHWIVTTVEAHQGRIDADDSDDERHDADKDVAIILSQATHYAIKFKTPFVALFDYNTLVLLVMTKVDEANSAGGEFTYMTIVTDSRQYRKAFLGFLLCAHEHAGRTNTWEMARNGTNILTTVATLGHMSTGGAGQSNTRAARAGGPASYREPGSSDFDSSQGSSMQVDSMRRAEQKVRGSAQRGDGRTPSTLRKSSSSLSTTSTSSAASGTSSRSATTVSSARSHDKRENGHGRGPGAQPAPAKPMNDSVPVRPKPTAAKAVASKRDGKAVDPKKANTVASKWEQITG